MCIYIFIYRFFFQFAIICIPEMHYHEKNNKSKRFHFIAFSCYFLGFSWRNALCVTNGSGPYIFVGRCPVDLVFAVNALRTCWFLMVGKAVEKGRRTPTFEDKRHLLKTSTKNNETPFRKKNHQAGPDRV